MDVGKLGISENSASGFYLRKLNGPLESGHSAGEALGRAEISVIEQVAERTTHIKLVL